LLLETLEHTEPLHKVTIIPRGPSLGSTMWLPEEDKYNTRKRELLDQLVVIMGGRVAEEIAFGDVTSGARGDIKQATAIARKMVCEWGMSEKLGMVEYGEHDDYVFLGKELSRSRDYSEATAQEIDKEVRKLCDDAYNRAMLLLTDKRGTLEAIAKALLEFETLDAGHIRELIEHGELRNPPKQEKAPPPLPPTPMESVPGDDADVPRELPPGGLPAPAPA
jgi:cell division protease FtsH